MNINVFTPLLLALLTYRGRQCDVEYLYNVDARCFYKHWYTSSEGRKSRLLGGVVSGFNVVTACRIYRNTRPWLVTDSHGTGTGLDTLQLKVKYLCIKFLLVFLLLIHLFHIGFLSKKPQTSVSKVPDLPSLNTKTPTFIKYCVWWEYVLGF